jgi:O-antigen/teichoic acid export membrane protein
MTTIKGFDVDVERQFLGRVIVAVADQGIISVANFVANATLIFYVTKDNYGIYVVALSTLLLICSTVDALFSMQMTFLAPHYPEHTRKAFCSNLRSAQACVSIAVGAVICVLSIAGGAIGSLSPTVSRFGLIIGVGSAMISGQEYYRALLYLYGRAHCVLLLTIVQLAVWVMVTLSASRYGYSLSEAMLAGYCFGGGTAAVLGRLLHPLPASRSWGAVLTSTKEAWDQGSWSMVGSVIATAQAQSHAWLLGLLAGASAVAEANFAKLFFSPLALMLVAVTRVARPALGKLYASCGERAAVRKGRNLLVSVIVLVTLYCPVVFLTEEWIISKSGAEAYNDVGALIAAWGLLTCLQITRWNSTLLLGVLRRNRQMTMLQSITAVLAIGISLMLIPKFGAIGALAGIGCGELVLTGLMWREVNRTQSNSLRLQPLDTAS